MLLYVTSLWSADFGVLRSLQAFRTKLSVSWEMNINYVSYFLQEARMAQYKKKKLPFASVSHSDTLHSSMKALRNTVKDLIPNFQVK